VLLRPYPGGKLIKEKIIMKKTKSIFSESKNDKALMVENLLSIARRMAREWRDFEFNNCNNREELPYRINAFLTLMLKFDKVNDVLKRVKKL
jgi:hypothetical protein